MYSITTDILMEAIPKATRKSVKVPLMCPMVCGQTLSLVLVLSKIFLMNIPVGGINLVHT